MAVTAVRPTYASEGRLSIAPEKLESAVLTRGEVRNHRSANSVADDEH
jgi:hypothetical protein